MSDTKTRRIARRWVISRYVDGDLQFLDKKTEGWVDDLQNAHVFEVLDNMEFHLALCKDENKKYPRAAHPVRITLDY